MNHSIRCLYICSYDVSASGMFVWAKLPAAASTSETYIDGLLYEKDLFVAPGTVFGSNGEGYIRFSLCVKKEKILDIFNLYSYELCNDGFIEFGIAFYNDDKLDEIYVCVGYTHPLALG